MRSNTLKLISLILGILAVICIALVIIKSRSVKESQKRYEELESSVFVQAESSVTEASGDESSEEDAASQAEESEPEPVLEPYECPIDFAALQETNPDIYAWIYIPNSDISYPLLQREDDDQFYLTHGFDGRFNAAGSIYTHDENRLDFTDFNTIIYGHCLYEGGMFTDLELYYDQFYRDSHKELVIYLPEKEIDYELYGVIIYNDYLLDALFDFSTDEGRMGFVDSLKECVDVRNYLDPDMPITPEDHLITLSTCVSGSGGKYRLLIIGKETLVRE